MATTAIDNDTPRVARPAEIFAADNRFYNRLTIALAIIILLAFAAFSAAGLTDWSRLPSITMVHAVVMVGWLGFFVFQGLLGSGRNVALHRRLGWWGVALAGLVVLTGIATGITTVSMARTPPFFSNGYFLALTTVQPLLFALFVTAAVSSRKRTDWHRRLMLGSLLVISEPAWGRLIPLILVPALGGPELGMERLLSQREWLPVLELLPQLVFVAIAMRHDAKLHGSIHRAHWWTIGAVVTLFVANKALEALPAFVSLADRLAAGG